MPDLRPHNIFGGTDDFLPVGGPGRIVAEVGEPSDRLAGGTHQKDAPTVPLGTECDTLSIWRKGRLGIVCRRILREIDWILAADPLGINVPVPLQISGVDKGFSIR